MVSLRLMFIWSLLSVNVVQRFRELAHNTLGLISDLIHCRLMQASCPRRLPILESPTLSHPSSLWSV